MSASDRLRELASAWDEGAISPEEMAELSTLLETDGDARRALVEEFMITSACARYTATDSRAVDSDARALGGPRRLWRGEGSAQRRTLALAAGLTVAAAAVVVTLIAPRTPVERAAHTGGSERMPVARITSVVGAGPSSPGAPGRKQVPFPVVGDEIASGGRIETGSGSVVLSYANDATEVSLGPDSVAIIDETGGVKGVRLEAGRLVARVAPQPLDRPMVFRTPYAEGIVLGTILSVEAGAGSSRLEVVEGRVLFRRLADGASVELGAGEYAVARSEGELVRQRVKRPIGAAAAPPRPPAERLFEGHKRILLTEYGSFDPYMLFGSIEGETVVVEGETCLALAFGAATDDWHGGVWLAASLPGQLADAPCVAVAFRFAGGGTLPRDAFVHLRMRSGAVYRSANLASQFADTSWREIVLRPEALSPDPNYLSQHQGLGMPPKPALNEIERVEIVCVSPPMRDPVRVRFGPFRMVIDRKED